MTNALHRVRDQYEKHPYPAIPLHTNVQSESLTRLRYEVGQYLRTGRRIAHTEQTRILVAGCGTFEPIVVAKAHAHAQITAIDLSQASLRRLKYRTWLNPGLLRRLKLLCEDLHNPALIETLGQFDYIICTGVLHHSENPDVMLKNLAALLAPNGVLRIMTYPGVSRIWVYALQNYFCELGVKPNYSACLNALKHFPADHPLRSTFDSYADARTRAGLIDGFFHAYDRPMPVMQLAQLCEESDLALLGTGHARHSRPASIVRALKEVGAPELLIAKVETLDAWEKIDLVDQLGELAVNPVYWLAKKPIPGTETETETVIGTGTVTDTDTDTRNPLTVNRTRNRRPLTFNGYPIPDSSDSPDYSLATVGAIQARGIRNALAYLGKTPETLYWLEKILEPRISAKGKVLPGLSSGDLIRELREFSFFSDEGLRKT